MKDTTQIAVAEIRTDLKDDTPDEDLMKKYGLTEYELRRVLEGLLRAIATGAIYVHRA